DGDRARDRQRLARDRQPWRWNKTFHRSFFWTLLITLSRPARWGASAARRPAGTRRRNSGTYASHARTRWETGARSAGGMRAAARLTWPAKRRTRPWRTCAGRPGALENWLTSHHALGTRSCAGLRSGSMSGSWRRRGPLQRRLINRARASLRCNHATLRDNGLLRSRFGGWSWRRSSFSGRGRWGFDRGRWRGYYDRRGRWRSLRCRGCLCGGEWRVDGLGGGHHGLFLTG